MKQLIAMAVAVALFGFAVPVTADEIDPRIQIEDGKVFLEHVYQVHPDHPGSGSITQVNCSDTDSVVYLLSASQYCTTGGHDTALYYVLIGFSISQPGLTGMLEHVVTSDAGEVRFQCTWDGGSWTGCQIISANWPGAGNDFCHDLWGHSAEGGTGLNLPNADGCDTTIEGLTSNSAPGGSGPANGPWTGYIWHG